MWLNEAKVLVTGGSSGIGYGVAQLLVERGAQVAICGRDEARLREAAAAIGATPIRGDVSVEADAVRMVREVIAAFGDFNVLVNNAGIGAFAPLVDVTAEQMRRVWEVNVLGATLMARESARHFVAQGTGNIINVASTAGLRAGAGGSAYASTKFALRGLSESWRAELRQHNVRVMLINPSEVVTEFFTRAGREQAENPTKLHPIEIAHAVVAMLTMKDVGFIPELSVWATNPRD
ncbi:MAG TPA: SDR family oxidoreductase [Gemmatimonadales bacterium]|nr:SDR family oxidoreductase [Gemmatimonadales bacterium]